MRKDHDMSLRTNGANRQREKLLQMLRDVEWLLRQHGRDLWISDSEDVHELDRAQNFIGGQVREILSRSRRRWQFAAEKMAPLTAADLRGIAEEVHAEAVAEGVTA